jgi:hypothetical protein
MAKQFVSLDDAHRAFIEAQHLFFVGTAAGTGRVNVSPKGMDSLRVLGPNRIRWRNLTGSGNETAGHLPLNPRMTLMWCAFDTRPMILRCYGTARMIAQADQTWDEANAAFPPDTGARQIYDLDIDLVQTSCGYAVPLMEFRADRDVLAKWSAQRDDSAMRDYWAEKNRVTIDGFPTGIDAPT